MSIEIAAVMSYLMHKEHLFVPIPPLPLLPSVVVALSSLILLLRNLSLQLLYALK